MESYTRRRGFTLIECLVTTEILGIGIVGIAGMFTCATLSQLKAAHMAEAQHIAEEALERTRAGDIAIFSSSSGSVSLPTGDLPRATSVLAWQPFPSGSTTDSLKLVAVNISWDWAGPSAGRYGVLTLIAAPTGAGS